MVPVIEQFDDKEFNFFNISSFSVINMAHNLLHDSILHILILNGKNLCDLLAFISSYDLIQTSIIFKLGNCYV